MTKKITAGARATVTLEISGLGSWGEETKMDQIFRQASQEARDVVLRMIARHPQTNMRLVGEPMIVCVSAEHEK